MGKKDPRIDAYIADAEPFARPILKHIRKTVHEAAPDVVETLKWGMPSFTLNGILCGMASFKAHATFGFWNEKGVSKALGTKIGKGEKEAMGQFGRITKLSDLPSSTALKKMVRIAAELDRAGVKTVRETKPRAALPMPADLTKALAKSAKARKTFDGLAPSHRREYIEWITEAKRDETRAKRLAQTIEWLAEGKRRNWKYENC